MVSQLDAGLGVQGTIPGHRHAYPLDADHVFEAGRPTPVCGNTAAMLGGGDSPSWLARHFQVHTAAISSIHWLQGSRGMLTCACSVRVDSVDEPIIGSEQHIL